MAITINRVYTRSGDRGETALVGGKRVPKDNLRVEAYGNIDELNAVLGYFCQALSPSTESLAPLIERLQQELFDLGSELATPAGVEYPGKICVVAEQVTRLERYCDEYGAGLPELSSFILPGGSPSAAAAHLARTVARRAERSIVRLLRQEKDKENPEIVKYLNRLSDLLFVLGRWCLRAEGRAEVLWKPGAGGRGV